MDAEEDHIFQSTNSSFQNGIEEDDDCDNEVFAGLAAWEPDPPERRPTCRNCGRPSPVCLCPYFPKNRLELSTSVYLVQHPNEESRVLRTAPLLTGSLSPNKCHIIKGKRLSSNKHAKLEAICSDPNTLLLYPGPEAVDITKVPSLPSDQSYNLIIIDGTWPQAKYIFKNNKMLKKPKQVQFSNVGVSQYVIRTQPTDGALSTVESAALALSVLEARPEIQDIMLAPLKALCQFQLDHGAVIHHSKERRRNGSPPDMEEEKMNELPPDMEEGEEKPPPSAGENEEEEVKTPPTDEENDKQESNTR